jgi:hypothetical protein
LERQHGDRGFIGQGECWSVFGRYHFGRILSGGEPHSVDAHRAGNVLEALLSHVVKGEIQTPGYVLLNTGRNANASGLSQTFQPSRDVHSVTEDVAVLHNNVALVNADTELNAIVARHGGISLTHPVLPLGRTSQGINHTGKFDQQSITGRFDDAAPVFGDLRVDNLRPDRP